MRKPGRPAKKVEPKTEEVVETVSNETVEISVEIPVKASVSNKPITCVASKNTPGCKFYHMGRTMNIREPISFYRCNCPEAPITGFITGAKECYKINTDGKCKFYEPRTA